MGVNLGEQHTLHRVELANGHHRKTQIATQNRMRLTSARGTAEVQLGNSLLDVGHGCKKSLGVVGRRSRVMLGAGLAFWFVLGGRRGS